MLRSMPPRTRCRYRRLATLAACLPLAFTAGCLGSKPEIVTQVVVKPILPEPVPPSLLADLPPVACPSERVEYPVPRLEDRSRCFERDSRVARSQLSQLQFAVKERESRAKELANRQ